MQRCQVPQIYKGGAHCIYAACTNVQMHALSQCCMYTQCAMGSPFNMVQNVMVKEQRVRLVQSKAAAAIVLDDSHLLWALLVQEALPYQARCRAGALWGRKWCPTSRAGGGCRTLSFWLSWRSAMCQPMCLDDSLALSQVLGLHPECRCEGLAIPALHLTATLCSVSLDVSQCSRQPGRS